MVGKVLTHSNNHLDHFNVNEWWCYTLSSLHVFYDVWTTLDKDVPFRPHLNAGRKSHAQLLHISKTRGSCVSLNMYGCKKIALRLVRAVAAKTGIYSEKS